MKHLIILPVMIFALLSASAQLQPVQRSINVNGSAEMEVVPDEIYVQVDLREYERKGSGKVNIETITNKFLAAVKSIGLTEQDISVQGYSGYDQNYWWWYKNKKNKDNPDMKATISYIIKLSSTARMDELVKKMDDEATQNFFIQRTWHSKMAEFRKQLKVQAIKNAKEKAQYLMEAGGYYPQPRMMAANSVMMEQKMAGDAGAPPAMNVDFKKMKLQFDVNVVFALRQLN